MRLSSCLSLLVRFGAEGVVALFPVKGGSANTPIASGAGPSRSAGNHPKSDCLLLDYAAESCRLSHPLKYAQVALYASSPSESTYPLSAECNSKRPVQDGS